MFHGVSVFLFIVYSLSLPSTEMKVTVKLMSFLFQLRCINTTILNPSHSQILLQGENCHKTKVKELSATVSWLWDVSNVKCTENSYIIEQTTGGGKVDLLLARMGRKNNLTFNNPNQLSPQLCCISCISIQVFSKHLHFLTSISVA